MATQTSYSQTHAVGYAGMIASELDPSLVSRNCEPSGGIPFGKVVIKGTGDRDVKLPTANGDTNYVGIAVRDQSARILSSGGGDKYNQRDEVLVMQEGIVWVTVAGNVAAGNPAYYTEATGGLDDASGSNITAIPNSRWIDTVASGGLARLQLGAF